MSILSLTLAPHPIFRQKSTDFEGVGEAERTLLEDLHETLIHFKGIGIAAPMVGISKKAVVIERDNETPLKMINPVITEKSSSFQVFEEASLCFLGISADIKRPDWVIVQYLDETGAAQTLRAEGFLATVVQHELDYLEGKIFLDYVTPLKRQVLLKKMKKYTQDTHGHVHSASCSH